MSSQPTDPEIVKSNSTDEPAEKDARTGQPIEEAEKNLSRHSNSDSSPAITEQERTTEPKDKA
ncbi:MAG TPA: hypothetical protein VGC64_10465 [Pyrinomonadaceae bacterium]